MIVFDKFWITMKEKGVSTYKLREEHGFNSKTIAKLRKNENITTQTLNRLCEILDCDVSDIIEYKKS